MYISVLCKTLLCTWVLIFSAIGNATPLTWTLSAVAPTLTPVPGVGGTFVYDAHTGCWIGMYTHAKQWIVARLPVILTLIFSSPVVQFRMAVPQYSFPWAAFRVVSPTCVSNLRPR